MLFKKPDASKASSSKSIVIASPQKAKTFLENHYKVQTYQSYTLQKVIFA